MKEQIKQLIINEILFAEYTVDSETVFLKMIRRPIPGNDLASEGLLITLIESVENIKFQRASYLNN